MIRIYMRVSTGRQKLDSQEADLKKYAEACGKDVRYYTDKFTGKTTDRPGLKKLLAEVQSGDEVVVWRLDRLGRTAVGLHQMFESFTNKKINFVSLRDSLNLATPAGRLVAGVLASVAQWETEVRAERVAAGLEAKRKKVAAGKDTWNVGRPKGSGKISALRLVKIKELLQEHPMTEVEKIIGVSRQAIYKALKKEKQQHG